MKNKQYRQMYQKNILLILVISLVSSMLIAQSRDMLMNQGDQAYKSEEYLTAQSYYTESDLKKPSVEATYNQANALFMQEKADEAKGLWERVTDSDDPNLKAAAYHNLGNIYLQNQKIDKAIEAYKQSLRIKPDDRGTQRNLALAQLMKEQDPQPQEQQSDENQEPQESDQEESSEEQQDSDQNEEQESQDSQQSEEEGSETESGEKTEEEQLEEMTKQELERLLEVLEEEDKKVQQKAAIGKTNGKETDKQW